MIVNPGIRRFLGIAIQRLFNSASFYAPLTHSLVLERGTGSPTFTRASTATFTDFEGVLRTAPAGCARFEGARMVDNLVRLGAAQSATLAVAANVTMTLPAGTYIFSMGIGTGRATFSGTGGATGTLDASASDRVSVVKTITAGTLIVTASIATLIDIQTENITGRTDQTTPSEYVSVGVASSPYYHGSMVDGVKCFPNDLSGNPIPSTTMLGYVAEGARTNLCLQSNAFTTTWLTTGTPTPTQNAVGPDGATSAWTLTDADGVDASVYQGITLTAAAWTASVFVKKTTGAQTSYPVLVFYPSDGTQVQAATVDTTNGVVTDWTSFTASTMASGRSVRISSFNDDYWRVELTKTGTAATHYFQLIPAGTTAPTYAGPTISAAAQGSAVFYGAQLNLGSFAGSYIATTTAAVTRNADVLTYSSAGNIDGTKGWCYAEVTSNAPNSEQVIYLAGTGAGGYVAYHDSDGALKLFDAAAARSLIAEPHPVTTPTSIAVSWGGSSSQGAVNGTVGSAQGFDGDISLAGANLGVGCNAAGVGQIFGNIGPIYIGQRQLSASEMQAVTA